MRKTFTGTVLAVALAAAVVATGPTAQAGTGDDKIRVVQHNTDTGGYQSALDVASSWGDVDAVTMQELCEADANALRQAGWGVHWAPQRSGITKCPAVDGKHRKGNAVLTQRRMGSTETIYLGTFGPKGEKRTFRLLCAQIKGSGVERLWVCTTHLTLGYGGDGSAMRAGQVATITRTLDDWVARGRRVVLAGDLNATPKSPEMSPLYRVQNGGTDSDKFWEGDQSDKTYCGDGLCRNMQKTTDDKPPSTTHPNGREGRKIDYFFASHRGVNPHTGVSKLAIETPTSGHHVVRGQVIFKPLG